jgi:methyl-accepting chemotaxis protein
MPGQLEPVTEAIAAHLAGWTPSGAQDVAETLQGITDMTAALSGAFTRVSEILEENPELAETAEGMRGLAERASQLEDAADEVHTAFAAKHAFWL